MRVGGLDVLFAGLAQQTFTDFELVLSDGLWKHRNELVALKACAYPFRVTHIEPFSNPFPVNSFCRYANTAIARARGELALMITDYTWLPPESLAVHWAAYEEGKAARVGLMCPHRYVELPQLNSAFWSYKNEEIDHYVNDLKNGDLESLMWSIFDKPFTGLLEDPRAMKTDPSTGADPKLTWPSGVVPPTYFHGKHESVPMQVLVDANGWDEDLDGTHGWQDAELAERLGARGVNWRLDNTNVACIVNPRSVFPLAKRLRPYETNEPIWRAKQARGYPTPNTWSIPFERGSLE